MLSLYAEKFLSFLCFTQTENVTNCFALNSLSPKHHMKFFREQIEFWLAPCLIDPWSFHLFFF